MKKLHVSLVIIIISVFIFLLSLPYILSEFDKKTFFGTHDIQGMDFKLGSEAKDIPLVSRIYKINDFVSGNITRQIEIGVQDEEKKVIQNELKELINREIIVKNTGTNNVDFYEKAEVKVKTSGIITSIKEFIIDIEGQEVNFLRDTETGKVITININGTGPLSINNDIEKLYKNFLLYLNLDLLEDWEIKDNVAISNKANLIVKREILAYGKESLLITAKNN